MDAKTGWFGIDRGAWVLLIVAALGVATLLGGCNGLGDGFARLIGAPTPTEIRQLEKQTEEADAKREAAETALADVVEIKDELDAQLGQLEQRIQQRVAQLPLVSVAERTDALASLATMQDEYVQLLAASGTVGKQHTALQREAHKWAAQYDTLRTKVDEKISAAYAAVDGMGEGVRSGGQFLADLGVPVAPWVEIAAKWSAGIGGLFLAGAGIRRQAHAATQANNTAGALKEVVVNTERFDLITGDETVKAAARRALSPTASAVLAAVTSNVPRGEAAAAVRAGTEPGPTKIS